MQTTTRLTGLPRTALLVAALIALLIFAALGFAAAGGRIPSFGPPHNPIAFWSTRDGQSQVYSMAVDGTRQTRLSDGKGKDSPSAWSPDRTTLAFASERNGTSGIYVMDADGGGVRLLTADAKHEGRRQVVARREDHRVPRGHVRVGLLSDLRDDRRWDEPARDHARRPVPLGARLVARRDQSSPSAAPRTAELRYLPDRPGRIGTDAG